MKNARKKQHIIEMFFILLPNNNDKYTYNYIDRLLATHYDKIIAEYLKPNVNPKRHLKVSK